MDQWAKFAEEALILGKGQPRGEVGRHIELWTDSDIMHDGRIGKMGWKIASIASTTNIRIVVRGETLHWHRLMRFASSSFAPASAAPASFPTLQAFFSTIPRVLLLWILLSRKTSLSSNDESYWKPEKHSFLWSHNGLWSKMIGSPKMDFLRFHEPSASLLPTERGGGQSKLATLASQPSCNPFYLILRNW